MAQSSVALQHLVLNRHPDGGLIGEGTSPVNKILCLTFSGFGSGTALKSARVYGCIGLL